MYYSLVMGRGGNPNPRNFFKAEAQNPKQFKITANKLENSQAEVRNCWKLCHLKHIFEQNPSNQYIKLEKESFHKPHELKKKLTSDTIPKKKGKISLEPSPSLEFIGKDQILT